MRTTDDNFRKLLRQKLEHAELPVSGGVWDGVATRLSAQNTASQGSSAVRGWWYVAASVIVVASGVLWFKGDGRPVKADLAKAKSTAILLIDNGANAQELTATASAMTPLPSAQNDGIRAQASNGPIEMPVARNAAGENTPNRSDGPVLAAIEGGITDHGKQESLRPARELSAAFTPQIVNADAMRWLFIPEEDKASTYLWDFGDGSVSHSMAGAHSFTDEGRYTVSLTVVSADGQIRSRTLDVDVKRPGKFDLPNVFTPNGDGVNDLFDPAYNAVNIAEIVEFTVLTPDGSVVISGTFQTPWDGLTMFGEACPPGPYRYIVRAIDIYGNPIEKTGLVRLSR